MFELAEENVIFFKQLVKNPLKTGAVMPSSEALAEFITRYLDVSNIDYVVELGAGTGRLTQAILDAGLSPEKLVVIEIDPTFVSYLKKKFPQLMIIQGDASNMDHFLPLEILGKVNVVVSGIPLINLSSDFIKRLCTSCFGIMQEDGYMLQFTYGPVSSIPAKELGLEKKRLGHVMQNVPPAFVWRYQKTKTPKEDLLSPKKNRFRKFKEKFLA